MVLVLMRWLRLLPLLVLMACGSPPEPGGPDDVARLEAAILSLGPGVDPLEAARAADLAYGHTYKLALEYEITDPPLVHNTKVNMGLKPRGLCWQWAEDMEKRLNAEGFATLEVHRAIANADNPFRIDHSTAIISRRGDPMQAGIILDPWRLGGRLFWARFADDTDYKWEPRLEVLKRKRMRLIAEAG